MRLLLCIAALLAGCTTTAFVPKEVKVPIPVPCLERALDKPALVSDGELLKMTDYQFVLALGMDRILRAQYERELEAVIQVCIKQP